MPNGPAILDVHSASDGYSSKSAGRENACSAVCVCECRMSYNAKLAYVPVNSNRNRRCWLLILCVYLRMFVPFVVCV